MIVPTTQLPLSDAQLHQLETEVDPMAESSDYGVDLYQRVLSIIGT